MCRHRGYAPCGQTPIIKIPARRKSLSLIAAVTNQGNKVFVLEVLSNSIGRFLDAARVTEDRAFEFTLITGR
jgi:hypothetical protein